MKRDTKVLLMAIDHQTAAKYKKILTLFMRMYGKILIFSDDDKTTHTLGTSIDTFKIYELDELMSYPAIIFTQEKYLDYFPENVSKIVLE